MGAINFGVVGVFISFAKPFIFAKKGFHFVGRTESDQQPAKRVTDKGPGMWHLSRSEDRIARFQFNAGRADFGDVLALDDVEPLILIVVQMTRRPAFLASVVPVLEEKKGAAAFTS